MSANTIFAGLSVDPPTLFCSAKGGAAMNDLSEFDYVLMDLANRMVPPEWYKQGSPGERGKVVFLLGAGCSRQYGLPSFVELLTYLWEDCLRRVPRRSLSLEHLRDNLDLFWQAQGPEDRRRILDYYLGGRVNGGNCPGYMHLARLASQGYVKAIINMNFDTLLEDALDKAGSNYRVATSFLVPDARRLMVYKPHGTIRLLEPEDERKIKQGGRRIRAKNELILDIAKSDLFTDPDEQKAAQKLLTGYDVVSVGYSGVDAKIAAALRAFASRKDPKDKKLFVVNVNRPDPRLLLVMAERASQELLISGEEAAFENFMGHLSRMVSRCQSGERLDEAPEVPQRNLKLMTSAERTALRECLRMALDIRLSMNIAEQSKTSIEEHGDNIFEACLDLAKNAGICLSPPEKYLLHCTAYLHDLGYYRGYTRAKAGQYPGWNLLCSHGQLTEELLNEKFEEDPGSLERITPNSYKQVQRGSSFQNLLCKLCAGHTGLVEPAAIDDCELEVEGVRVPVRFTLLVRLFAVAEDLSEGHPFFPSADPVGPTHSKDEAQETSQNSWAIVDPVLNLYLHQARPVEFASERRRVVAKEGSAGRPATLEWLLTMAAGHIARFDFAVREAGGWGVELVSDSKPILTKTEHLEYLLKHYEYLLEAALSENFLQALDRIPQGSIGEDVSILDLISIYTMSTPGTQRREPRIPLALSTKKSSVLNRALDRVGRTLGRKQIVPVTGLFGFYLTLKKKDEASWTEMERIFMRSFDSILYPASRFFSRNWHDGIEATLMARVCFDLGFSRFRWEVMDGLRHLLEEKIFNGKVEGHVHGHDQCTICTSRLLYVFTHARRLIPHEEMNRCAKGLDQVIAGILRYMIDLDPEADIWWGLQPDEEHQGKIKSAEYLAWAARAVTCCLSLDLELRKSKDPEDWLGEQCGLDRSRLHLLVGQRWDHLLSADKDKLLSPLAEEPHSFVFGHVAMACLDLQRFDPEVRALAVGGREDKIETFSQALQNAATDIGTLSQLSGFFLWPLQLFLDSLGDAKAASKAVDLCYLCVTSPVWIKAGAEAGSWGFNVKNTQTIVTSLMAFWQYVFEDKERQERFGQIFEERMSQGGAQSARPKRGAPSPDRRAQGAGAK